jgi:hypothetical protein
MQEILSLFGSQIQVLRAAGLVTYFATDGETDLHAVQQVAPAKQTGESLE